jgi:hypothetical protein
MKTEEYLSRDGGHDRRVSLCSEDHVVTDFAYEWLEDHRYDASYIKVEWRKEMYQYRFGEIGPIYEIYAWCTEADAKTAAMVLQRAFNYAKKQREQKE